METLDIMPDTGYYQTQYGKKYMLHEAYLLDVGCWPAIYTGCKQSYFNVVWRESFPQVMLRKHCRFAKCEFCIDKRDIISSVAACLCWLAERLVFDEIFLLFLPTGHTHFDPDQYHTCHIATAIAGCGSGRGVSRSRVPQIQRDQ
jgi:hypothetical protein